MLERTARPRSLAAGEQAHLGAESQHRTETVKFYNNLERVVGSLDGRWLVKKVDSRKHQLRRPLAWAVDEQHLVQLRELGAEGVHLIDEQDRVWAATLDMFDAYGFRLDRGHGVQVALPLSRWLRAIPSVQQLSLFEGLV